MKITLLLFFATAVVQHDNTDLGSKMNEVKSFFSFGQESGRVKNAQTENRRGDRKWRITFPDISETVMKGPRERKDHEMEANQKLQETAAQPWDYSPYLGNSVSKLFSQRRSSRTLFKREIALGVFYYREMFKTQRIQGAMVDCV
uniref:Neuropeptide n=1 Tax=Angiostrongylus cantonensis TaxID=6313 RepID=A0A0K0D0U0_ANGCA